MAEIKRNITIRDPFGVQIGVIGDGPLVEMFSGVGAFFASLREGTLLGLLRDPQKLLSETQLEELSAGLDYDDKANLVEITEGFKLEYFVNAGAQGRIGIKRAGDQIDGRTVQPGQAYSVFGLAAHLDAGASVPIPLAHGVTITPGLRGGVALEILNYRRHTEIEPVLEIVKSAIGEFRFPFNPDSVVKLREGDFITYRFDGTLAVTTEVAWGMTTNILFDRLSDLSHLSPDLKQASLFGSTIDLGVHVAAQAALSFVHGFTDEFDLRVEKKGGGVVALTVSKAREKQSEVGFNFAVGVGPHVGPTIQSSLSKLLSDRLPQVSADQIAKLTDRLFDAVERAVVKRAKIEFATSYRKIDRNDVFFQLEFDLAKDGARRAYSKTAEGDLTAALDATKDTASGVKLIRSVLETLNAQELDVALNLFGIFSFQSVQELIEKAVIESDEAGEVSIYHEDSFKAKSQTSLGHLKMADFLFKATWNRGQGVGAEGKDFDFTLLYTFSEQDQFTSQRELINVLELGVSLGVIREAEKQEILSVPVEFRRALTWPIIGLFSPESTYGRSSVLIQSTFSEAGLASILKHEDDVVWPVYCRAYKIANPNSRATDWFDPQVRKTIDQDGWAAYVNVADTTLRHHRHAVVSEYNKAKQFIMTLRVFRQAVQSGKKDEELIALMSKASKAAKSFHFDKAAFVALNLLCRTDGRDTRLLIEGEKINAIFPMGQS